MSIANDNEGAGTAKCREKTARGNWFPGKRAARQAAASYRRKTGADITFFRCQFCPHYHLGCRRGPEERAARNRSTT